MPQPPFGDGPWGEAIRYWLNAQHLRQSDLARSTGIEPKTISSITRGFHTNTRSLEKIANAFKVPLEAVLISPQRRLASEERRRLAADIAEDVLRKLEAGAQSTVRKESIDDAIQPAIDNFENEIAKAERPPVVVRPTKKRKRGRR